MITGRILRYTIIYFVTCLFSLNSFGDWWNPMALLRTKGPKQIKILLVTGNYTESRILAELIQYSMKQPILLLPGKNKEEKLYFLTSDKKSLDVRKKDYVKFIDFLQPMQILFLGSEAYTKQEYIDQVKDFIPVWSVPGNNWEMNVRAVQEILKIKNLELNYLSLRHQLDDQGQVVSPISSDIFRKYRTKKQYWDTSGDKKKQ